MVKIQFLPGTPTATGDTETDSEHKRERLYSCYIGGRITDSL